MKKKLLSFIFVIFACFGLIACHKTTTTTTTKKTRSSDTTQSIKTTKSTETTTTKYYTTLPLDLTGESFTISCSNINGGSYNSNWNNGTTIEGYKIGGYRIGSNASSVYPDDTLYKHTAYGGRQGAVYNVSPINDIKALEITYSTQYTYASNPVSPNVSFGDTKRCNDYKYTLEVTDKTEITTTVNVNGIGFDYFSVNTGDYALNLNSIKVIYTSSSQGQTIVTPASGEGKVRINPYTFTGTKVAGQTKVTVPMEVEYDSATNTYIVTEEKTYTYYTFNYVKNHPECKDDATQIAPIDVANYFTIFGTWPANYAEAKGSISTNTIYSTFGKNTRQVSIYNGTYGYANSVPWNGTGYYYELDIDLDGRYSTGSRGSGRVVAWKSGFNATGYDNSPVCLYTDDHYNTWLEYYNNGTWSNRYNGEGNVTGVSFLAPTTVTLTGFDPKIVAGTPTGDDDDPVTPTPGGGGEIPNVQIDDSAYYANYAPATLINEQTAKWQKVTNVSGIVEGNKYMIAYGTGSQTALYDGYMWESNNGVLEFTGSENDKYYYDIDNPFYFEKVEGGYYLYTIDKYTQEKTYLKFSGNKGQLGNGQSLWQIAFSGGDFYLYVNDSGVNYSLQRNYENGRTLWKTYKVGSQSPIQIYRFCDIEGATPPVKPEQFNVDYNYVLVDSVKKIRDKYEYIFIYGGNDIIKNLTATNEATYKFDWYNNLQVSEKAEYDVLHFAKHTDKNGYDYYEIYKIIDGVNSYLSYGTDFNVAWSSSPAYFEFNNGSINIIKLVELDEGEIVPVVTDNDWLFLVYDTNANDFAYRTNESSYYNNQLSLYKVVDANYQETFNSNYERITSYDDVNDEDEYILVCDSTLRCVTDDSDATYKIERDKLYVSTEAEYDLLHFKKYTENLYGFVYYEIYKIVDGVNYYLSYDKNFF